MQKLRDDLVAQITGAKDNAKADVAELKKTDTGVSPLTRWWPRTCGRGALASPGAMRHANVAVAAPASLAGVLGCVDGPRM